VPLFPSSQGFSSSANLGANGPATPPLHKNFPALNAAEGKAPAALSSSMFTLGVASPACFTRIFAILDRGRREIGRTGLAVSYGARFALHTFRAAGLDLWISAVYLWVLRVGGRGMGFNENYYRRRAREELQAAARALTPAAALRRRELAGCSLPSCRLELAQQAKALCASPRRDLAWLTPQCL